MRRVDQSETLETIEPNYPLLLANLANEAGTAREMRDVFLALTRFVNAVRPGSNLFVAMHLPETDMKQCVFAWSNGEVEDVDDLPLLQMNDAPNSEAIRTGEVVVIDDFFDVIQNLPSVLIGEDRDDTEPEASIAVPMIVHGKPIGAFEAQHCRKGAFNSSNIPAFQLAGNLAAIGLENIRLLQRERRLRQEAQELASKYSHLVEGLDAVAYECTVEDREFTTVGGRIEPILGIDAAELVADPGSIWRLDVVNSDYDPSWRDAAIEKREGQCEYRIKRPDGTFAQIREKLLVHDGTVNGLLLDVTQQWNLAEQLRHAQKMEAIGRLAGGVAHDFNNMLAVINGYSELLLMDLDASHPCFAGLTEISRAGERASGLTRQLLAFSRKQLLEPTIIDLNSAVEGLTRMLGRLIGEDIELRLELGPDAGSIRMDPTQLEQILMNLAVNARDAMPHGGSIQIRTARRSWNDLDPRLDPGIDWALVEMRDTGAGIPAEVLEHVFEPFFTTKEPGKGTGLGLSTVYGIVEQNGGQVFVSSSPGVGTCFSIYLRREEGESPEDDPAPLMAKGANQLILLVEDEQMVRDLVLGVLREAGYRVIAFDNGESALKHMVDESPHIDLLLSDAVMPHMTGPELARRLRSCSPELPILFMSGYAADPTLHQAVASSDVHFIQKPFTPSVILAKVEAALTPR